MDDDTVSSRSGRLDGRVAVVTGAASGIGLAITRRFLAEGASVMGADINGDGLDAVAGDLAPSYGDAFTPYRCDVTDEDQVQALVAATIERHRRLDISVINAGTGGASQIVDIPLAEWRRVVDLCLTGAFLTLKHTASVMQAGGSIIVMASLNAIQPGKGMASYCSAKAGVAMLAQVAALELGPKQIRCNTIAPGLIMTTLTEPLTAVPGVIDEYVENTPLGRAGQPDEIANAALFLASDESAFMNGSFVSVDGGANTMRYPDVLAGVDRLLAGS
jgi:NAD(P)-dependent dehydrogenase (short-subunit alcohol dehydrogenase family)